MKEEVTRNGEVNMMTPKEEERVRNPRAERKRSPAVESDLGKVKEPPVVQTVGPCVGKEPPYDSIVTELLDVCKQYAEGGFYVVPLNGKIPRKKGWQEAAHLEWMPEWGAGNVGILAGEKSGIIVLDVDPKNGGDKSMAELENKHGKIDTVTCMSGGGGWHYYFRYPEGAGIRNSVSGLGAGLDIKSNGGYIVAPPSVHPDTREKYVWAEGKAPWEKELAEIPQWLLSRLTKKGQLLKGVGLNVVADGEPIPEGGRNDTLFRIACRLHRSGTPLEATMSEIKAENLSKCEPPLEDSEVETIVNGIYGRYEQPALAQATFPKLDPKGKPIKDHWENTYHACEYKDISFRRNLLTQEVETVGDCVLSEKSYDTMLTTLRGELAEIGHVISEEQLARHIEVIAEMNQYHPVQEYLNACKEQWDGDSRIEQLFSCFILTQEGEANKEILFSLFLKWLISCVVMVFNEGKDSAQGILVLKGDQGIGKTRWLRYLLPLEGQSWGKDGVALDPTIKDDVMKATKFWIVELGEIRASIRREKLDRLKAFTTESVDVYRRPYDRKEAKNPRRTVFFGTVNNDEFLKDETGERRYWVIPLLEIQLDESLDIDQLWGEIAHLALDGKVPYWLSSEEIEEVNKMNEEYRVTTKEEQVIMDTYDWESPKDGWLEKKAKEVCLDCGLQVWQTKMVGRVLSRMAKEGRIEKRRIGDKGQMYKLPATALDSFGQPVTAIQTVAGLVN
jgi:Predicted P-loop ATPase and inactivated derivatives